MTNKCPRCGSDNRPGALVCAACHLSLVVGPTTKQLAPAEVPVLSSPGTVKFSAHMRVLLHIGDAKLDVPINDQITLGRSQDGMIGKPDIDLAPYNAFERGVSRWHAILKRDDQILTVTDTTSANGTWLNGQRLRPGVPQVLADGDTLWLGQLRMDVYFYYA